MPREMVILFLSLFSMAGATVLLFPVMRALAERIRPRLSDAGLRDEVQAMRDELLLEIQQARREIGDLDERVDFTERLLAKKSQT
jgi:hypothetical protein